MTTSTSVNLHHEPSVVGRVLALTLAVLALVGVVTWQRMLTPSTSPAPHTALSGTSVDPAYAPGGSVYNQQVPTATTVDSAYAPGGSVYNQQVPTATTVDSAYAPGGSVYNQQVPHN